MRQGESTTSWADMGGIPVLVFKDDQDSLALSSRDGELTIFVIKAGERRPSRMISVAAKGHVVSAQLGPQPGENFPMRMTPEQTTEWRKLRKSYRSAEKASQLGTWGEEFKAGWQLEADQALAAIARVMAR